MIVRLLVAAAVVLPVWCVRADEAPRFVGARFDATTQVVRFEAPIAMDWQAAARAHFTRFDFERLSAADLAHLRGNIWEISGAAEETFSFAPPAGARAGSYHLISSQGIAPLRVAAYEGTIRFGFDQSKPPAHTSTMYFGEALSQTGVSGGGFALLSRTEAPPARIESAQVDVAQHADGVTLTYRDGETQASIAFPKKWHRSLETAFGLRVGDRRYLFVDWPPDTQGFGGLCEDEFSLYEVGKTLNEVAASSYDCDV